MTKTLAEIYLQQGHVKEAYEILRTLHERNPSDKEVGEKLKDLSEKYGLSSPPGTEKTLSTGERIRILESWLARIREGRGK